MEYPPTRRQTSSNISTLLVAAVLMATVSGCMSMGNESLRRESEATIPQKLVEGRTTKADVRVMFGSPVTTSFTDAGLEIWKYELSKMSADAVTFVPIVNFFGSSMSGTKKELVILFDEKGILKRYSMSESPVSVKTGVFNQ